MRHQEGKAILGVQVRSTSVLRTLFPDPPRNGLGIARGFVRNLSIEA